MNTDAHKDEMRGLSFQSFLPALGSVPVIYELIAHKTIPFDR